MKEGTGKGCEIRMWGEKLRVDVQVGVGLDTLAGLDEQWTLDVSFSLVSKTVCGQEAGKNAIAFHCYSHICSIGNNA